MDTEEQNSSPETKSLARHLYIWFSLVLQGTIYEVSNQNEIRDLQPTLQPGDAMIMQADGDWDYPNRVRIFLI